MVQFEPNIYGIAFVIAFCMCCICVVRLSYFRMFSAYFFITFLSPGVSTSVNTISFFIIADCDVRFIVMNGSAGWPWLFPLYMLPVC